tara:strand:- start:568 stop:1503 length:936 start_codon:yes stop_codon:yes gene_type:complete
MKDYIEPFNQTKLFGLDLFLKQLVKLEDKNNLPNKILFSGQKGQGKSTLAYHFINFVLSKKEEFKYNFKNFEIDINNHSFKTIINGSNPNFFLIDVTPEKKNIDILQIRQLIRNLNKSSLNEKPRFVLIDNIEFLNINSLNALLKTLEEPSTNTNFILIHNNKKVLPTLLSRCINFKISLTHEENINVICKLLNEQIYERINPSLINYYFTPGNIFNLIKYCELNGYNLNELNLREFLKLIINDKDFRKNKSINHLIFDFMEFYFNKINSSLSKNVFDKYNYFLKRISDTKKFNLDEDSLFLEFESKILND